MLASRTSPTNYATGLSGRRAVVYDDFTGASGNVVRPKVGLGIWAVNSTWQLNGSGSVNCTAHAVAPTNNNFVWTETQMPNNYVIIGRIDPSGTDTDKGFGFCFNAQDQFNNYRVTFHGSEAQGYSYAKFRSRFLDVLDGEYDITLYSEMNDSDLFGVVVLPTTYYLTKNGIQNSDVFDKENTTLNTYTRAGLASNFDLVSSCSEFSIEAL